MRKFQWVATALMVAIIVLGAAAIPATAQGVQPASGCTQQAADLLAAIVIRGGGSLRVQLDPTNPCAFVVSPAEGGTPVAPQGATPVAAPRVGAAGGLTPTPAATPAPVLVVPLDYQDDAHGCQPTGWENFPACWLQRVQSGLVTPTDAIVAIQKMAAAQGANSFDAWTSLDVHAISPTLVWCPAADCGWVPDTAFPLLRAEGVPMEFYYSVGIVSAHPAAGPATVTNVTCPAGDCWAVLLK